MVLAGFQPQETTMQYHRWLLPLIVVIVTVKVKIISRRR